MVCACEGISSAPVVIRFGIAQRTAWQSLGGNAPVDQNGQLNTGFRSRALARPTFSTFVSREQR
jgi:hypothetical protein